MQSPGKQTSADNINHQLLLARWRKASLYSLCIHVTGKVLDDGLEMHTPIGLNAVTKSKELHFFAEQNPRIAYFYRDEGTNHSHPREIAP
jgi:hypothetical protein